MSAEGWSVERWDADQRAMFAALKEDAVAVDRPDLVDWYERLARALPEIELP